MGAVACIWGKFGAEFDGHIGSHTSSAGKIRDGRW
jgi:hypothetical protein